MQTELLSPTLSAEEYFASAGLSQSAMKDLAVSPYRFWYLHINPNRPERKETAEMRFGTALHCAVLEPAKFEDRYTCEIEPDDFPGCLRTMDDLREWLKSKGLPSSGKTKRELIDRVSAADSSAVIYDVAEQMHAEENAERLLLSKDEWTRARRAAESLRSEPKLAAILENGQSEVCMAAKDPETGVLLKARMDWITPTVTLDLKTFTVQRGRSVDKSVTSAIFYEGYYRQAFLYSTIRALAAGNQKISGPQTAPEYILGFVESDEPHEVRLRSLRPKCGGEVNVYWQQARLECRELIRTYAECMERFGNRPWRNPREIDPLMDEELPQMAYA
jgi:hypothetical protein